MLLSRLTVSALEAWLLAGVRLGGGDREKRRAFFALETPDAERLLDVEAGEATFFDRERRMRAFLRALYGVSPPIRETPPGRHDGAGRRASFGGGVVRMPPSFPGFRKRPAFGGSFAFQGVAWSRSLRRPGVRTSWTGRRAEVGTT